MISITNSTRDCSRRRSSVQNLHNRKSARAEKKHQPSSTIISPTQYIEERDDIETNNTRAQRSSVEQRQVYVKGNSMKTRGWFWYLYGIAAFCIFIGSSYAAHVFFKLQLAHRTPENIERCQHEDPRCHKLSQKELSNLQRQMKGETSFDTDTVGIVSTSNAPLSDLLPWIHYHRMIGVQKFYIFCTHSEQQFNEISLAMRDPKNHPDGWSYNDNVELIPLYNKVLEPKDLNSAAAYASNPDRFYASRFDRTVEDFWLSYEERNLCGDHFLTIQTLNADEGIELALRDGIDWLAHIDTDEFLFSGHHTMNGKVNVNIGKILQKVDKQIGNLRIKNYEGVPEVSEVSNKFKDTTLFNKDMSTFHGYTNGKGIGRVTDSLIAFDMHRFTQRKDSELMDPWQNYLDNIVVLHYAQGSFKAILGRGERDKKRCKNKSLSSIFLFDIQVRVNAHKWKNDEKSFKEWYHETFVLGDNKEEEKMRKLKAGNMIRVEIPSDILNYLASQEGTKLVDN